MDVVKWKVKLKKACIENNTYEDSFDSSLQVLAEAMSRRDDAKEQYINFGGTTMIKNNEGQMIKNPALSIIESCDKDILPYLRDLGLTPAGLKRIENEPTKVKAQKKDVFDNLLDEVMN